MLVEKLEEVFCPSPAVPSELSSPVGSDAELTSSNLAVAEHDALSYSTQLPSLILAKEHVNLSSTLPNTLVAKKSSACPSTTTTPCPTKRLLVKHVSEIEILDPAAAEIAKPLP